MQINMTAAQMTAVMQNAGLGGKNAADASFSGDFMELLMQLLGNTDGGDASQMLLGLFGVGQEETADASLLQGISDGDGLSQEQQQNAMEMMAALLQSADAQNAQQMMEAAPQETLSAAPQSIADQFVLLRQETQPSKAAAQAGTDAPVPFMVQAQTQQVKDVTAQDVSAQALFLQGRFQNAVQKAKALSGEEEKPRAEAADIQMLEGRVQTAVKTDTAQSGRPQLDTQDLAKQLAQSVPKALQEGKSEFTLKLKPEGLGEITVKLTQEAGKTAVTIASTLPQTEKLIGTQISALEKALEPMGVTIRQEPMQQMAAQQQSMTDQNRQFMLWQQNQQQKQPGREWGAQGEAAEEFSAQQSVPTAVLDTYI